MFVSLLCVFGSGMHLKESQDVVPLRAAADVDGISAGIMIAGWDGGD